MTISIAWVRKKGSVEELVVASDSRLSFGRRWDCCPKLRALPRNDSVIAFSGDTMYAYPIMLQVMAAVSQHQRILSRAMDLQDLKGHLLRILNSMTGLVHDLPRGAVNEPDATFIFSGWSWKKSQFLAWLLHYDSGLKRFTFKPASPWSGTSANRNKYLVFTGDYKTEFYKRLVSLLRSRRKLETSGFDMEPFEVLRDMLRSGEFDTIGGAPQIIKVYKHMNCRPYAVFWPDAKDMQVSLLGRPLLDYERSEFLVLDPDLLTTVKHVDVAQQPDSMLLEAQYSWQRVES